MGGSLASYIGSSCFVTVALLYSKNDFIQTTRYIHTPCAARTILQLKKDGGGASSFFDLIVLDLEQISQITKTHTFLSLASSHYE